MATDSEFALVQENIEEYINDENKIVTCKWLSLMLSLHINTAKRALYTFVEQQRNKGGNDDINVTYFVAGLGKSKSGEWEHKCVVVPESDLEAVKKSLSVVTSCHIYSVQKAKLKDYTALYMTDYDIIRNNLESCTSYSSIKCPWMALKAERQQGKPTGKETVPVKSEKRAETPEAPVTGTATTTSSAMSKPAAKKAEPKGSIANMFAAAGKKGGGDEKATSTPAVSKAKPPPAKKGMLAFFSADSGNKKTADKKTAASPVKQEPKAQTKEKSSISNSKKADDSDGEPDRKRRRRIRTDLFDSSEDEDDEERLEEEEEAMVQAESPIVVPSESVEAVSDDGSNDKDDDREESPLPAGQGDAKDKSPWKSSVNGESGRKRKRTKKVVSKQYLDEDGFMVTKKEVEWQSEDDSEEDVEQKGGEDTPKSDNTEAAKADSRKTASHKPEPKGKVAPKKPAISPQKGKQTALTSFFKRK